MQYERQIDETTDLSTLTDQEIMRLMEGMDASVMNKPLITGPVHLLAIKGEYLNGSTEVLRKLEWLQDNGWDQVWRARGDGDCFYRSFTLAYLLHILYSSTRSDDASKALKAIHDTMPTMASVGFQQDLVDEFVEPLISIISSLVDPPPGQEPTEFSLLEVLQDPEKSNSIVVALRLMTAAYIRTHPDDFAPFLFSPSTLEPVSPEQFCREEVEPCGKEADHAQIMALAAALAVPVRVAYLDRSEVSTDVINWVEFGNAAANDESSLTLLYRPGHFDVVTKDQMVEALARSSGHAGPSGVHAGPSGSAPSGSAPSGSAPSGSASSGTAPSGTAPFGSASEPSASSSTVPTERVSSSDEDAPAQSAVSATNVPLSQEAPPPVPQPAAVFQSAP
ncbi:hypothetical protein CcaverHIS002_0312060 [Cutaneotrichosporon cavernicola]|nr:hypothetical protein CcaverHIS002_0312060 [Cutaneotrichosporon cavernicola]BEI98899.1 hypothetical protein CcaverHIS631_0311980 [Cutaneotrichosporon cavernicola]BEJ06672.1 hypothetical protein CcaverHIS641_0311940 [Cutaneotrichosporon cavernicola]